MHECHNLGDVSRASGRRALESRMSSKDSCPVWGGAVGKGPMWYLAGRLLHCTSGSERGIGQTATGNRGMAAPSLLYAAATCGAGKIFIIKDESGAAGTNN